MNSHTFFKHLFKKNPILVFILTLEILKILIINRYSHIFDDFESNFL